MTLRTKKPQRAQGTESPTVRQTQRVPLLHNSAFVLGPRSNAQWLHGVRADKRPAQQKSDEELSYGGERISITFRQIGTFADEKQRKIWGQGARRKSKATAGTVPRGNVAEVEAMVAAFGKENHQLDFDWDAEYGQGFDVINLVNDKPKLSLCENEVANLRVQLYLAEKVIPYTTILREESPSPRPPRTRFQPWTHGLSNTQTQSSKISTKMQPGPKATSQFYSTSTASTLPDTSRCVTTASPSRFCARVHANNAVQRTSVPLARVAGRFTSRRSITGDAFASAAAFERWHRLLWNDPVIRIHRCNENVGRLCGGSPVYR